MYRPVCAFAGRTYYIVGNLMSRLNYIKSRFNKTYMCKNVIIFLSISLTSVFGCSKEPSRCDGSFEHPQPLFWFRNKKTIFNYAFISKGLLYLPIGGVQWTLCVSKIVRFNKVTDLWNSEVDSGEMSGKSRGHPKNVIQCNMYSTIVRRGSILIHIKCRLIRACLANLTRNWWIKWPYNPKIRKEEKKWVWSLEQLPYFGRLFRPLSPPINCNISPFSCWIFLCSTRLPNVYPILNCAGFQL